MKTLAALVFLQTATPPIALQQALELADHYNWSDAAPLFHKAQKEAGTQSDKRSELYARLGVIRATMERQNLPELSKSVAQELETNPLLQTDTELRLFALTIKGDIDLEIDAKLARRSWEQARDLANQTKNEKWIRRTSGELGFVSFLEGDLATAKQLVGKALFDSMMSGDWGAQIRYLVGTGTGLVQLKAWAEGMKHLDQALAIEAKNPKAGYNFPARESKMQALAGLRQREAAHKLGEEILAQARQRHKQVKEAQVTGGLGEMALNDGDYAKAETWLRDSLRLSEDGGFTRLQARAYFSLSALKIKTGDTKTAAELATRATELTRQSGDLYLLPDRLYFLARLKMALADYGAAKQILAQAAEVIEASLTSTTSPTLRSALVHTRSDVLTRHFVLHAEHLNDIEGAFAVLESSRARTTRDLILRQQTQTPASSLSNVQRALNSNEVLLEYVLTDPASFCLIITDKSIRIEKLPGNRELEPLLTEYATALRKREKAEELGRKLYDAILSPVTEIKTRPQILIARHGALHMVPFEALLSPSGSYAVLSHTFAYTPSGTTLALLREQPRRALATKEFLGVGGVPYDTSPLPKIAATRGYEAKLGNLPSSEEEIETAARALRPEMKATMLLGPAATESAFKQAAPEHRVIHLAVHGKASQLLPMEAALVLLRDEKSGDDGLLQLQELLDLDLKANLVLLSACDTGTGKLLGEDGISNLSRAFLARGVNSVVSTLWQADDVFALTLMKKFYGHLAQGENARVAMTNAKRDVIRTFGAKAAPWYWAPYIVEGLGTFTITEAP